MQSGEDDEAFHAFVNARWQALVTTAWMVTADRHLAEDCVQEALVGVHRHWKKIAADGNVESYARRAALNSALSWRRRRRIAEITVDQVPEVRAAAEAGDEFDPDLVAALRSLPPRMRAVVALRFVEDRSEVETASLLGCSLGTVKSQAHKGLARLRSVLLAAPPGVTGQVGEAGEVGEAGGAGPAGEAGPAGPAVARSYLLPDPEAQGGAR